MVLRILKALTENPNPGLRCCSRTLTACSSILTEDPEVLRELREEEEVGGPSVDVRGSRPTCSPTQLVW